MTTETLVLVPGLACTAALFAPQLPTLSARRRVMVADHTLGDSIAAIAGRLLAEAPERFDLLGLSMGGYVALEVMRQAPGRVSRLALLDTSARSDSAEATANRERLIALAAAGRYEEIEPVLWDRLVAPHRRTDADLRTIVAQMHRQTGPEVFVRQQRAIMSRADSTGLLPAIEIPTLVLVGAEDAITPPDLAREMADAIEWASLVVVPECGHLSSLERPEAVTHALSDWLDRGLR
ncbi:MAG TPA: alpha/beta fold hydrolase [Beijerinckiaceae bacterium]|jgi:pimeloyl-ACP methyl ester carboxylesterase